MITGAHTLLYSNNPELDRDFFRDVLSLPNVDVGEGWLIFGLPPSEFAVHGSSNGEGGTHELYLLCEEIDSFVNDMQSRDVECSPVEDQGWGLVTHVTLPGGSKLGVYEPRHARPDNPGSQAAEPETTPAPPKKKRAAKKKTKAKPAVKSAPKAKAGRAKKTAKKKKR